MQRREGLLAGYVGGIRHLPRIHTPTAARNRNTQTANIFDWNAVLLRNTIRSHPGEDPAEGHEPPDRAPLAAARGLSQSSVASTEVK
ncbi:uncharacterized protein EI97DRAFT_10097 [Westerdykella ornata]|uniref:Uncharacterized protein n=1 Tax=Westerdykella ornata TaxID=318751 RepID=A0A6A6JXD9_WESOR|nr:uncharacterized protein EI97DRAFT_10097 [Westerdykella ornata]KAF2280854.1 hypothetical protein EI97DRAFT_10097 [Westerdykella ornata]